ncbi:MAG: hypothetical protein ACRDI3_03740 [Actinomycetota bacterium]
MADFASGRIQCFIGPTELGAADDLEQVIVLGNEIETEFEV